VDPRTPKDPRSSLAGRVTRQVSVRPGRRGTEPRAEVRLGDLRARQSRRIRSQVRGGRGHRGLGCRVDRDGELDVAAELLGQGLGDQGAQPGLQLFLDELVRRRDEGGVFHQPERPGKFQPGPLMRLDLQVGQPVEGSGPDICQV